MADGRSSDLWNHTAAMMALTANINRDKKTRPFRPATFHPYLSKKRPVKSHVSVARLTDQIMAVADGNLEKTRRTPSAKDHQ